jgi:hypothetical protein
MNSSQRRKQDRNGVKRKFRIGDEVRCKTKYFNEINGLMSFLSSKYSRLSSDLLFDQFTVFKIIAKVNLKKEYILCKIDTVKGEEFEHTIRFNESEIEHNKFHKRRTL